MEAEQPAYIRLSDHVCRTALAAGFGYHQNQRLKNLETLTYRLQPVQKPTVSALTLTILFESLP